MKMLTNLVVTVVLAATGTLSAEMSSYTGTFTMDDQVQTFSVVLATTSVVTFDTLSYGGGTNLLGALIAHGGFDPRLTWFQADGTEVGSDNGGHCGSTQMYLGACNDAFFHGTLSAGTYTLVLTEDGNDSLGALADGFSQSGNGNFTANPPCTQFCDPLSSTQLDGHWAVDVLTTPVSTTPEPMSFVLTGSALAVLGFVRRRNRL